MSLTKKQAAFVEAYLLEPNGKKAAIAAGYAHDSAEVTASKLIRHPKVAEELDRKRTILSARAGITPEMVLAELAKVGFSDIRQVLEWRSIERRLFDEHGEPADVPALVLEIRDSADLTAEGAASISEISQGKDGTVKVKMHDKLGALVRIGQHFGMFKPVSAEEPGKKEQAEDLSRRAHQGTGWDGLLQ